MATWYTSPLGSDSNAGTSIGAPFLTIGHALSVASTGDLIAVRSDGSGTYTITASLTVTQSDITIQGFQNTVGDGGIKPLITTTTNSVTLINTGSINGGITKLDNLSLSNTASVRGSGIWQLSAHGTTQAWVISNCIFDGFASAINCSNLTPDDVAFIIVNGCEIKNDSGYGVWTVSVVSTNTFVRILSCNFHDNWGHVNIGAFCAGTSITRSRFWNGTGSSCLYFEHGILSFDFNTVANNVGPGLLLEDASHSSQLYFSNNIFYGNTTYGISDPGPTLDTRRSSAAGRNNFYGANGSGPYFGFTASPGDTAISVDPFVSASTGDFNLNNTPGGGAVCRGAAYGDPNLDVGALQHVAGGGGSVNGANVWVALT